MCSKYMIQYSKVVLLKASLFILSFISVSGYISKDINSTSKMVARSRVLSTETIVAQLAGLPKLTAKLATNLSLSERKKQCTEHLKVAIMNRTIYNLVLSEAELNWISPLNQTRMLTELCELEAKLTYMHFYFEQWANSLERYISKVWIEGFVLPVLQTIHLLFLVVHGYPVFSRLSDINYDSAKWYLLRTYVIIALVHALCSDFGNVIVGILNWFGDYHHLIKYTKPENLSKFMCPTYVFIDQLLRYLPNWIVLLLLWDQILRQRAVDPETVSVASEPSSSLGHERRSRVFRSLASRPSVDPQNRSTTLQREYGVTTISREDAIIRNGLTKFGAKLMTITLFVLHVFINIHSLWLYSVVDGTCKIDREKHSYIFYLGYPYFLQIIHCFVPNIGCLIGVIYSTWLAVQYHRHLARSAPLSTTQRITTLKIPSIRKPSITLSTQSTHENQLGVHAAGQNKSQQFSLYKWQSCELKVKVHASNFKSHLIELSMLAPDLQSHNFDRNLISPRRRALNDLSLLIGIGVCYLLYMTPENIEWLCMTELVEITNENVAKNYELIKFWNLVKYVIKCWSLFAKVLLLVMTFCLSFSVRQQFVLFYRSLFQCRHRKCTWCCCGFYCDFNKLRLQQTETDFQHPICSNTE